MTRRQTATVVFIVLCVVLVATAVSLNIGWILGSGSVLPLAFGVVAFALIIAGIIVYTVFLVRELRRTEQQDSFLNAVSHELKTPIASIRLYLETLQARDVPDGQRQEFYRIMLDDTVRLQYTVEQVLRAGVASQRRRLAHRAPVDLGALAVDCIATVRQRLHLPEAAVSLASAAPAAPLMVDGDADELRTAIGNLLDNAVKYSGDAVHVTVELASPSPTTVWVRVRDRGVGIPRRHLRRIFNRFYRFQARGFMVKGTGLGLYIVRSIARQHGGRVFAESTGEGAGSTFTLELPKLAEPSAG
jgi:signal transduction histidine kinase